MYGRGLGVCVHAYGARARDHNHTGEWRTSLQLEHGNLQPK